MRPVKWGPPDLKALRELPAPKVLKAPRALLERKGHRVLKALRV